MKKSLQSLLAARVGDAGKASGCFMKNKKLKRKLFRNVIFLLPLILLKGCIFIRICLIKVHLNCVFRVCSLKEFYSILVK